MTPGQRRRENLAKFIEQEHDGNKGQFADRIGTKRPQVYRYFAKSGKGQEPGEEFARRVEGVYGLSRGYFDRDPSLSGPKLLDLLQARMEADPGLRVLVQMLVDDPETPIPEAIRDSLKPLLNAMRDAIRNAAYPASMQATAAPLPKSLRTGRPA